MKLLERVIDQDANFRPALETLGRALVKKGDAARAVTVLERAVQIDPNYPDVRYLLGRAYTAVGRREEAKREFEAAQKLTAKERTRLEEGVNRQKPLKKKRF